MSVNVLDFYELLDFINKVPKVQDANIVPKNVATVASITVPKDKFTTFN